jgi:hypothetical protein
MSLNNNGNNTDSDNKTISTKEITYPSGENSKLKTPPCIACLKFSPWSHDVHGRIEEYNRFENLSAYPNGNRWPISLCLNQELFIILVLTFDMSSGLDFYLPTTRTFQECNEKLIDCNFRQILTGWNTP